MGMAIQPQDLYPDRKTVAEIDARLVNDWLLDLAPDERRILDRYPDHPRWVAKLEEANERAVARHDSGGRFDEREIWRLMARPSLFAQRGANRRHYILDGIAMAVGIARRFDITDPILDAGCHLGVSASVLARLLPNEVVGIDPIGATIDAARALNTGVANLSFVRSGLPWSTDRRFGLVLCYDVLDHLGEGEQRRAIASLAQLTYDGGFIVLSGMMLVDAGWADCANEWFSQGGLGYVTCDVHGGFGGNPLEWASNPVAILRKGCSEPMPADLVERAKREWDNHFANYANARTTPRREATQAFERALRSAPLPVA
ncbi:class I SAM-dependent methyltransferase [Methylobacterium aquaticum]|uniref:Methyltransferase domain-containing protein n=1 Tax=Methylobacterium aquaticum TaxID=270351 RepID=A0A0C6FSL9_9HYPH|nr:class I SAM-dependent methyltransferase [Methylobacterium aquaticum]BAQ45815.1 hypothetical protein Maq22A_c12900 [Methylobacterium aquaticum]